MERLLDHRAVVITGAARGLGAAFAKAVAGEGARVIVNDVDAPEAALVVEQIRDSGGTAVASIGSITDEGFASSLIDECIGRFGSIDGLVNNAGVFHWRPAFEETADSMRRIVEVNLLGSMFVGVAALRRMREQNGGSVVNVTSAAMRGTPNQSAYGATKGGMATLTFAWAKEGERYGIRVNALAPRAVTRLSELVLDRRPETMTGDPAWLAPMVTYLLSDLAAGVSGQLIRMNERSVSVLRQMSFTEPASGDDDWTPQLLAELFDKPPYGASLHGSDHFGIDAAQ